MKRDGSNRMQKVTISLPEFFGSASTPPLEYTQLIVLRNIGQFAPNDSLHQVDISVLAGT